MVLRARCLGLPLSLCPPRRLCLARVTGPRRSPSFGDPSAAAFTGSLGTKWLSRRRRGGEGGRAAGFGGAPSSPAWHRQEGLFSVFVNTFSRMSCAFEASPASKVFISQAIHQRRLEIAVSLGLLGRASDAQSPRSPPVLRWLLPGCRGAMGRVWGRTPGTGPRVGGSGGGGLV